MSLNPDGNATQQNIYLYTERGGNIKYRHMMNVQKVQSLLHITAVIIHGRKLHWTENLVFINISIHTSPDHRCLIKTYNLGHEH